MHCPDTPSGCRPRSRRLAPWGRIPAVVLPSLPTSLILSVLALLFAAPLRAQDEFEPYPPTISPESGTFTSATVPVMVTFFDETSLNTDTRHIYLGAVEVTGLLTHTAPAPHPTLGGQQTSSSGTLTLNPGANVFRAEICDNGPAPGNCTSAEMTYTYLSGRPEVRVSPDGGVATAVEGVANTHTFRVANPGTLAASYALRAECRDAWTGTRLSGCTLSTGSVAVPAGDSVAVTVTAPAVGAGSTLLVRLVAELTSMPGVQDAGWVDVSVGGPGGTTRAAPVLKRMDPYGPRIERGDCVAVAVAPGAAYECGDLRVSHALPTHRTYNRAWTPALVYNSQQAHPMPTVYANVSVPSDAPVPTSVQVVVTLADNTTRTASFPGSEFTPGILRRVAVQWDGLTTVTGVYPYTVQATSHYTGQSIASDTLQGRVVVVNRHESPFGAGWWLAGWERLQCIDCGTNNELLWVGGDGSTRIFTRVPSGANRWTAPNPAGILDSLALTGAVYVRKLHGGGQIEFDGQWRQVRTLNRLGQATHFAINATTGMLDSIRAPVPAGQAAPGWRFTYTGGHVEFVSAFAPGAADRQMEFGYVAGWRPMNRIIDPDGVSTWFYYPSQMSPAEPYSPRMRSMLDRRGTRHVFTYDGAHRLASVRLWMGTTTETADDIIQGFQAAEGRGVAQAGGWGTSVAVAQAYTLLDGPRTDVNDHTQLWLTSRGAPRRIRDAVGTETVLVRGDSRFPSLVTQVYGSNARGDSTVLKSSAAFDTRGRVTTSTVHNPLGDNANVVTTYGWNNQWNRPSWIKAPGTDTVRIEYSATTGNPLWRQQGGSLRRVYFDYNTAGQVIATRYPHPDNGAENGGGQDQMAYDARGNLKRTVSPLGFVTLMYRDALGRVTETISPVHAASSSDSASVANTGLRQTVAYDALDRDTLSRTIGRAMTLNRQSSFALVLGTPEETLTRRTTYDTGGPPLTVQRWSTPDTAHVGVLTTTYEYDRAGRKVAERDGGPLNESYTYDRAGNMVTRLAPGGEAPVTMSYDAVGRVTRRIVPSILYAPENVNCSDQAWTNCNFHFPRFPASGAYTVRGDTALFSFDAAGNMIRAENGDAIVSRTFYPGGALATDSLRIRTWDRAQSSLHMYGVAYGYDQAGRMRSLEHPRNLTGGIAQSDEFRYDPGTSALDSVVSRTGLRFGYTQDLQGQVVSETFPGGYNTHRYDLGGRRRAREGAYVDSLTYDARGKVLSATVGTSTSYNHYSGVGNLVATEWRNLNAAQEVEEFRVDALGHTAWSRSVRDGDGGNHPEYRYGYESGHSRISLIFNVLPATYVDSLQFTRDTTYRTYDEAGNVEMGSKRSWRTDLRKIQTRSYFAADGQLRAEQGFEEMNGTPYLLHERRGYFTEHRYDALGRRVLVRTRRDGLCYKASTTIADCTGGITRYVWAGDNLLWEMRGPGADSVPDARLNDISAPGQEFGVVGYTHAGGIDRPLVVWKGMGSSPTDVVVPHANWRGVFGKGTNSSGGASTVPVEWPGFKTTAYHRMGPSQQPTTNWMGSLIGGHREPGGTMYMRNRYYDPQTGQFTQTDPIGIGGGLNTYGFAAGDPVSYSDPLGLRVCLRANKHQTRMTVANQIAVQKAALELATDSEITLDAGNCISRVIGNPDNEMYRRLAFLVAHPNRIHIRFMSGWAGRSGRHNAKWGPQVALNDPDDAWGVVNLSGVPGHYATNRLQCIIGGREPATYAAVLVHELLGHVYGGLAPGGDDSDDEAIRLENVYHRGADEAVRLCHR